MVITMRYSGRIIITAVVALLILGVRFYFVIYYNYPPYQFPMIGAILLLVSWLMGTQYDKLKFLSDKDVLTGLYNRRYMLYTFPKKVALADRRREKLILYFVDVDEFKIINDSLGHEVGDRVLQQVANALMLHSNNRDLVVRWAGDEFLILSLSSSGSIDHNKSTLISRIHDELKLVSQSFNIAVSVSIGTALYPNEAKTLDHLLHEADQDMYNRKSNK